MNKFLVLGLIALLVFASGCVQQTPDDGDNNTTDNTTGNETVGNETLGDNTTGNETA